MRVNQVGAETRDLRHRIRYDSVCLTCSKKLTGSQLSLPHGSILGQILFLLYTADLIQLIECHDLSPHLYADDTQVYGLCRLSMTTQLFDRM